MICLSGCLNGPVCHELRHGNYKEGIEWIRKLHALFEDRFYIEMQMPGEEIEGGRDAFRMLAILSREMGIPAVITNDCHYHTRQEFKIQMVMMATSQRTTIDDPELFHVNSDEQFFKTRAELRQTFIENKYTDYMELEEFEEACENTLVIADRCEGFDPSIAPKLPVVANADDELRLIVAQGLMSRGLHEDHRYVERVQVELDRFIEKGFSSYFLITKDLCDFSRKNDWMIGPGRGSCGGSLVCYLLNIHSLDPIKWNLSFDSIFKFVPWR